MKKQILFIQGAGGYEEDKKLVESLELDKGGHQLNNDLSKVAQDIQTLCEAKERTL